MIVTPLLLMGIGHGLAMPNANAGGVSIHPHLAGTAAGLSGFVQMIGAGLATVGMSAVPHDTAWPIAVLFIATAVITIGGAALASRSKS